MKKMALFAFLVICILPLSSPRAQDARTIYTAYDIDVDATGRTAVTARDEAIRQAERKGFEALLRKLAGVESVNYADNLRGEEIRRMVRGMEFNEERSSARRYIANVNISYDPAQVRVFMGQYRIAYTEITSEPRLIVPIWQSEGRDILFRSDNPLLDAIRGLDTRNRLISLVQPSGDFQDKVNLTARNVAGQNRDWVINYAESRYGATDLAVLRASLEPALFEGTRRLRLEFLRSDGSWEILTTTQDLSVSLSTHVRESLDEVLDALDEEWRAETLTQFGNFENISLRFFSDTAKEWVDARQRLEQVPIIRDIQYMLISVPESELEISYQGSRRQLGLALEQVGLAIRVIDSVEVLMPLTDARRLQARAQ